MVHIYNFVLSINAYFHKRFVFYEMPNYLVKLVQITLGENEVMEEEASPSQLLKQVFI